MHNEYALRTILEKVIAPTSYAISLSNRVGAHTEFGQLLLNDHVLEILVDIEHNIKKIYTFYCNDESEQDGHLGLTWEDVVIQNRKMNFSQFVSGALWRPSVISHLLSVFACVLPSTSMANTSDILRLSHAPPTDSIFSRLWTLS